MFGRQTFGHFRPVPSFATQLPTLLVSPPPDLCGYGAGDSHSPIARQWGTRTTCFTAGQAIRTQGGPTSFPLSISPYRVRIEQVPRGTLLFVDGRSDISDPLPPW